jgi:hypothetical protein
MARAEADTKTSPREILRLRERLDEWRKGTGGGVALPEKLWASAGRLAQRHGVYTTARALGLGYNKLKRASGGAVTKSVCRSKTVAVPKAMKFVELTGALSMTAGGCWLSIQNTSGQRLAINAQPLEKVKVGLNGAPTQQVHRPFPA